VEIRAALLAEFEIIADLKTTTWTEHNHSFSGKEFVVPPLGGIVWLHGIDL
jgi:hypothetical protein